MLVGEGRPFGRQLRIVLRIEEGIAVRCTHLTNEGKSWRGTAWRTWEDTLVCGAE